MQPKAYSLTLTAGTVTSNSTTLTAVLSDNGNLENRSPVTFITSGRAQFDNGQASITTETDTVGVATALLSDAFSEKVTVTAFSNDHGVSAITDVIFGSGAAALTAPSVVQAGNGNSIPANVQAVTLRIPAWAGMAVGQTVTYDWTGTLASGGTRYLSDSVPVTAFTLNHDIDFDLAPSDAVTPFDDGSVDVSYSVTGIGDSAIRHYSVGAGATQSLPAPVVTNAAGSVVPPGSSATVTASYPGMTAGDTLSLTWQPYAAGGSAGTPYTSTPQRHPV